MCAIINYGKGVVGSTGKGKGVRVPLQKRVLLGVCSGCVPLQKVPLWKRVLQGGLN